MEVTPKPGPRNAQLKSHLQKCKSHFGKFCPTLITDERAGQQVHLLRGRGQLLRDMAGMEQAFPLLKTPK